MCLDSLDKGDLKSLPLTGKGWKVVYAKAESWMPEIKDALWPTHFGEGPIPRGKWLRAKTKTVYMNNRWLPGPTYKSGFHIYATKAGAQKAIDQEGKGGWGLYGPSRSPVIVKVEWKGLRAIGRQGGQKVIVAQAMKVMAAEPTKAVITQPTRAKVTKGKSK